jgi:hypothetical protein
MVYKIINKFHIDNLKETGQLLIGTFKRYRQAEEQQIRDESEGLKLWSNDGEAIDNIPIEEIMKGSNIKIESTSGKVRFSVAKGGDIKAGITYPNAFIFSTSMADPEKMKIRFNKNNYFTIKDIDVFGRMLLNAVEKVIVPNRVFIYCFDKVKYVKTKNVRLLPEQKKENIRIIGKPGEIINITQGRVREMFWYYFLKEEIFKQEKEFRFVFLCREEIEVDRIFVKLSKSDIQDFIL